MKRQFDAACRQYQVKEAGGAGQAEWPDGLKSGFPSVKMLGKTEQAENPAPETPQEVKSNNTTVRSLGKNLFNPESSFYIADSNYNTKWIPKYEDGVFYTGARHGSDHGCMVCIPVEPGEIYTLAYETAVGIPSNGGILGFSQRDENGVGTGRIVMRYGEIPSPYTFTIPEGIQYIGINPAFSATRYEIGLRKIHLEKGSVSTSYKQYFDGGEATAPKLMCAADGSCQSTYDPQTGKFVNWWWDKLTFNGTEAWSAHRPSENIAGFYLSGALPEAMCENACWSNQTAPQSASPKERTKAHLICGLHDSRLRAYQFGFYDDTLPDKGLANWKTHLAAHPLEVWVARNEPEITNIGAQRLTCPTGFGQIIQVAGDVPDAPMEVKYLAHGGNVK